MSNNKFLNPYVTELELAKFCRQPPPTQFAINFYISKADYDLLKTTRVQTGTLSITGSTLLNKLCNELRKLNITDISRVDDFESFVANCNITDGRGLPDSPTSGNGGRTDAPANGRANEGESVANPSNATELPCLQTGSGKARRGSSGKGAKAN